MKRVYTREQTKIFDEYGKYYDLFYQEKNYPAEVSCLQETLKQFSLIGSDLLEFGSGTGRHAELLVERGYRVHGIEKSTEMLARAVKVDGFTCQHGDICNLKIGRTFDAVFGLFHVFSYFTTNNEVKAFFANAKLHLKDNGILVFDFWFTPAVFHQGTKVTVKKFLEGSMEVTRIAEPVMRIAENIVDVNYEVITRDTANERVEFVRETHSMRHFSLPELDVLAENFGFKRISAEELVTRRAPSLDTWAVCIAMRKC